MKNHHETFLQQMIALGGAARWFLDHAKFEAGDGERCREIMKRADSLTDLLRWMPWWKKILFNLFLQ